MVWLLNTGVPGVLNGLTMPIDAGRAGRAGRFGASDSGFGCETVSDLDGNRTCAIFGRSTVPCKGNVAPHFFAEKTVRHHTFVDVLPACLGIRSAVAGQIARVVRYRRHGWP